MKNIAISARSLIGSFVISAAVFGGSSIPASAQEQIGLASTSSASGWYSFHAGFASLVNRNTDEMNVSVVETGGAADSQAMVHARQVPVGLGNWLELPQMMTGDGEWEGRGAETLRSIVAVTAVPNVLVVRSDSGIDSIEDLAGKRINPGGIGTSTEAVTVAVMELLGVEPDWQIAGMSDAADFFRDRRIDGFFKTSGAVDQPDALIEELQAAIDLKLLGFSEEQAEEIRNSGLAITFDVPAGTYNNQPDPVISKGLAYGYFAHSDTLSNRQAYDMFRAVAENPDVMDSIYPGGDAPDLIALTMASTIPLHAGVVEYLLEHGHDVPDNLIPEEFER